MPSHTFNTVAGTTATGGTGGAAAGVTSNVITDLVASVSEGSGFIHAQQAISGNTANVKTRWGLNYYVSGTSGLRLVATDDSQATGTGSGARTDYAYARGPNSASNAQTTYNDKTGGVTANSGSTGTYEWRQTEFTDGEGFTETRLDVIWNGATVYTQIFWFGATEVVGTDGFTYTRGSIFSGVGTTPARYGLTRSNPGKTIYINNTTSGNITGIKMKLVVTTVSEPGGGQIVALRSLTNTSGGSASGNLGPITTTGTYDSGWLTSGMSTGLTVVCNHVPNIATSIPSDIQYFFTGRGELWARASGVSDTKVKDFNFAVSTIAQL
ncbi:MAG: hypothetical protein ISR34_12040 [Pirellulales bacterium]|nr:hypothetical protein [Pirellulales bacterium]